MSTFSIRLRELRKERKETQEEIGRLMGLKRSTFSAYERGVIVPPMDNITYLSKHFGVSVDYLMGKVNYRNPLNRSPHDDGILDVKRQLEIIDEELKNGVSVVKIGSKELDPHEKELMGQSVQSAINMAILIGWKECRK